MCSARASTCRKELYTYFHLHLGRVLGRCHFCRRQYDFLYGCRYLLVDLSSILYVEYHQRWRPRDHGVSRMALISNSLIWWIDEFLLNDKTKCLSFSGKFSEHISRVSHPMSYRFPSSAHFLEGVHRISHCSLRSLFAFAGMSPLV